MRPWSERAAWAAMVVLLAVATWWATEVLMPEDWPRVGETPRPTSDEDAEEAWYQESWELYSAKERVVSWTLGLGVLAAVASFLWSARSRPVLEAWAGSPATAAWIDAAVLLTVFLGPLTLWESHRPFWDHAAHGGFARNAHWWRAAHGMGAVAGMMATAGAFALPIVWGRGAAAAGMWVAIAGAGFALAAARDLCEVVLEQAQNGPLSEGLERLVSLDGLWLSGRALLALVPAVVCRQAHLAHRRWARGLDETPSGGAGPNLQDRIAPWAAGSAVLAASSGAIGASLAALRWTHGGSTWEIAEPTTLALAGVASGVAAILAWRQRAVRGGGGLRWLGIGGVAQLVSAVTVLTLYGWWTTWVLGDVLPILLLAWLGLRAWQQFVDAPAGEPAPAP